MKFEKSKISIKNGKSKIPKTIKDIEDTLKEMDRIHNTSFYDWIKDENNASVIAFKTKDLFQEHYENQPELVYNALRFLCKDWKLSKIAELILKLFYKSNIASEKLAIIIYEVSLLLENPEKVDLISLLLIGEEPKNVAFFLYHFFQYTEKKYREHTEILNEEEFLDEMNSFCSGILECLFSCLKWNNEYFKELIIEYIMLSTLEIDARREFLIRMVNVKYSRFQQELQDRKENTKSKNTKINSSYDHDNDNKISNNERINESEEVFKRSLNFGILIYNMFQIVMRTDEDDLLTVSTSTKETYNKTTKDIITNENTKDEIANDNELADDLLSENSLSICSNKRVSLKRNKEQMKKEESSTTLWNNNDNENDISIQVNTMNENIENYISNNNDYNTSKDSFSSAIYNYGYDSSYCKNNDTNLNEESISISDDFSSYHFEELFNESFSINDDDATEVDLLDEFFNKSFVSTSSSRRNSMLSFINDDNFNNNGNGYANGNGNISRRNSRYSLNLSVHSLSCINSNINNNNNNNLDEKSTTTTTTININHINNCNCNRYNNYSDTLLHAFPSPPISPALSATSQTSFIINDHEIIDHSNSGNNNNNCSSSNDNDVFEHSIGNSSFLNLNDPCCSNNYCHPFSPEIIPPSPIVQSLSMDNIFITNTCGYSCTFNHINSSTPTLHSNTNTSHKNNN